MFTFRNYYEVKPGNNIALIELHKPIRDNSKMIFPCLQEAHHGNYVGTCGMGSLSGSQRIYPNILYEIQLKTSNIATPYSILDIGQRKRCRDDVVCTNRAAKGGNICFKDEGIKQHCFLCISATKPFRDFLTDHNFE